MQATFGHRIAIGSFRFTRILAAAALAVLLTVLVVGAIGTASPPAAQAGPDVERALVDHRAGERASWALQQDALQDALVERALIDHRAGERATR